MSTSSTMIGDRRRAALQRAQSIGNHPSKRPVARPATPPTTVFYVLSVVVAVFVMLGLVMVLSASSISQFHKGNSPWRLFNRQAMWAALGLVGLGVALRTPYRVWRRFINPGLIIACSAMVLPFIPGVGLEVNGARAWVGVGSFSFQPSEFLKLAVLLGCANLLAARKDEMDNPRRTLLPVLGIGGLGACLCLVQSDLGSAIVLGAIVFAVAFIGGAPLVPMSLAGLGGLGFGAIFVVSSPRRLHRWRNPKVRPPQRPPSPRQGRPPPSFRRVPCRVQRRRPGRISRQQRHHRPDGAPAPARHQTTQWRTDRLRPIALPQAHANVIAPFGARHPSRSTSAASPAVTRATLNNNQE